jgi:DNA-directed RNA polymerase III subunit RPC4
LYFFQFPSPFPEFTQKPTSPPLTDNSTAPEDTSRKVAFTEDVKMEQGPSKGVDSSKEPDNQQPKIDGIIGQLEIYRSGTVKMRLANGIVLDVRHVQIMWSTLLLNVFLADKCSNPTLLPSASSVS